MFISSVLIIMTSMITLGIFIIIGENANAMLSKMQDADDMVVYLDSDIDKDTTESVRAELKKNKSVKGMTFQSKKEVVESIRKSMFEGDDIDLTLGWEDSDEFSAVFNIELSDDIKTSEQAEEVIASIEKINGVSSVGFDGEVYNTIVKISGVVKIVVLVIFILLVGISLLVISNTIKLGLHARRKEINIMKYIGATDGFVKTPFVIEGIIVGLTGAIIAWIITVNAYDALKVGIGSSMFFDPVDVSSKLLKIDVIIGVLVGCFGCMISIKKYLKV